MGFNPMPGYWTENYKGTPAELALEPHIAALGLPYRTQLPLFLFGPLKFFPDFALPTIGWVIEVDDSSHEDKVEEDAIRTQKLEAIGYRVIRCTNEEAINAPMAVMARLAIARAAHGDRNLGIPGGNRRSPKRKKPPAHKGKVARKAKGLPRGDKGIKWNSSHSSRSSEQSFFSPESKSSVSWLLRPAPRRMTRHSTISSR